MTRPGARLRGLCARWCSAGTMARLVDPIVADLQTEHAAAARRGTWAARRARAIGYVAFAKAIAIHGCRVYWRAITAASGGDWWRTVRAPIVAIVVSTIAVTAPWAFVGHRASLLLWLVPQALAVSLPIGLAVGLLVGRSPFRRQSAPILSVIVLGASLVSFANVAWVFPAANQTFRLSVAGRPLIRGLNELTLGELGTLLEPGSHGPMRVAQPADRASIASAYHSRWALWFATLLLALFAFVVRTRASRRAAIVAAAIAASLGYDGLVWVGFTLAGHRMWSPAAAAWLANGVFALATLALLVTRGQQPVANCE